MPTIMDGRIIFTTVTLLLLVASGHAQNSLIFKDPSASNGCQCVVIEQCPSLRPILGVRLTYQQATKIQQAKCGFLDRSIKVCCTDATSGPSTPTPRPPITPTPRPPTAPGTSSHPTELPLSCGFTPASDRIYGGGNAPLGAHPWAVAVGYTVPIQRGAGTAVSFQCGGALITAQHVVTAAHCVHPSDTGVQTVKQINIGDWNLATDPDCVSSGTRRTCAPPVEVRRPSKVTWHPLYNTNNANNYDLAIIRLDRPVRFGVFVQPICIPNNFDSTRSDQAPPALATGWGKTERSDGPNIMQEVRLPFADFDTCNDTWGGRLSVNQICAGGVEGQDTCVGDSGGPLITTGKHGPPYQLVGLTSFGSRSCGTEDRYGVYTDVSKLRAWIVENLAN